jgi:peroxiredoxin Q/BCP
VSEDGKSSHEAFKAKHSLPFVLLSDPGGETAKAYGVKKTLGLLPGRVTFVIDREGVVRSAFDSQVRVKEHVAQALEVVKRLAR